MFSRKDEYLFGPMLCFAFFPPSIYSTFYLKDIGMTVSIFSKSFKHWKIISDRHIASWFRTTEVGVGKMPIEIKFGVARPSPFGSRLLTDQGSISKFLLTLIFCVWRTFEIPSWLNLVREQSNLGASHLSRYKWLRNEQDRPPLCTWAMYSLWRNAEAETEWFVHSLIQHTLSLAHFVIWTIIHLLAVSPNQDVNCLKARLCLLCPLLELLR